MSLDSGLRGAGNLVVGNPRRRKVAHPPNAPRPDPTLPNLGTHSRLGEDKLRRAQRPANRRCAAFSPGRYGHRSMIPTSEADIRFAIVPASIAQIPRLRQLASFCSGAEGSDSADLNSNGTQIRESAEGESRDGEGTWVQGALHGPQALETTSSFVTMRKPSRLPIVWQSCHGIPINQATGENNQPKICSTLDGNHPFRAERASCEPR